MKIIEPYAKLISQRPWDNLIFTASEGIEQLRIIEWFARISHRSEEAMTDNSYDRFLQFVVMDKGDWSVVEHGVVRVDFYVDRGITHEIVRHRLFSFTQESTRFCNYGKKDGQITVIVPPLDLNNPKENTGLMDWKVAVSKCEEEYLEMLARGISPQIARSVLPNSLASRIGITGNLRNWRHFLLMRTTLESHPQMRQVTIPLLQEFKSKIPILYDDIEPLAKQSENLKKMR
jgi:thymidylate synthase (FAD)